MEDVLHLGAALVLELLHRDITGVLGAEVHGHFRRGDRNHNALDGLSIIYRFDGVLKHLLEALLGLHRSGLFDFVAHLLFYLLNDPLGHRGSGGDTYGIQCHKRRQVQLLRAFHEEDAGTHLRANFCQVAAVGAVLPANDHHSITFLS